MREPLLVIELRGPPRALTKFTSRSRRLIMSAREAASVTTFPLIHSRVRRRGRVRERVGDAVSGARQLRLVASGDGWALVTLAGEPVFSAAGLRGRWCCLEFAHNRGVVALVS
jgi:hypothetical protein